MLERLVASYFSMKSISETTYGSRTIHLNHSTLCGLKKTSTKGALINDIQFIYFLLILRLYNRLIICIIP